LVINVAKALGLIEVRGKLGAILAADAAVKAANIILIGSEVISGGLTTIHIIGDVAAVKSAVEAGEAAVASKNCLISSHVIPRLDGQVEQMLMKSFRKKKNNSLDLKQLNEHIMEEKKDALLMPMNDSEEILQENSENEENTIVNSSFDKEQLEKMKVTELRSLANDLDLSAIKKSEIKIANKAMLIEALLEKGVEH